MRTYFWEQYLSLSRCRIQFGRWRSWFSTLLGFLFFRWSRLHWFSTAGWGFSWSSAVVFLCFSRPQFSQWLRCSQVHAFSWYVPGNSFAPLWFCSSISSLFYISLMVFGMHSNWYELMRWAHNIDGNENHDNYHSSSFSDGRRHAQKSGLESSIQ